VIVAALAAALVLGGALPASADDPPPPVSGAGSDAVNDILDRWRWDVATSSGLTVNYSGIGSLAGRAYFHAGWVDFALDAQPSVPASGGSAPESRSHAGVPAVGSGLALAYQLWADGTWITDLRLSSSTIAGIFTGTITAWNDPAVQADNPGVALPATPVVPVLRRDYSATTLLLTEWLAAEQPAAWSAFTVANGMPDAPAAVLPVFPGARDLAGSYGVAGYVDQVYGAGAITYVENAYAQELGLTVAQVQNASGAFVPPAPQAVTAALRSARIDRDPMSPGYGSPDFQPVFDSTDPHAYPLSHYSEILLPTQESTHFSASKGAALTAFTAQALCAGQQWAAPLGYAALPMNLVAHGFTELARIPGSTVALDVATCANPANTGGAISPLFGEFDSTAGASATVVNGNLVIRATPAHAGATVDVWVEGEATPRHTGVALNTSGSATLSSTVPAGRKVALTQGTSVLAWLSTADVEYLEPSDATHAATKVTIPTPAPGTTSVTIPAGAAQANQTFSALGWSTPTSLGQVTTDGTGAATIDASALGLGDHTIALVDGSGEYVAWGTATFTAAPAEGDLEVNVTATGVFSLTGVATSVNLGDVQRGEVTSAALPNFTVIDDRALLPGWTLTAAVDTFINGAAGGDQIPASALSIAPAIVSGESAGLSLPGSPLTGSGVFAEGALNSSTLEAGTVFNALLSFAAPATAKAGTYTSTLTLTLVSK
jgi:phosphate transport system substrate-binding protein